MTLQILVKSICLKNKERLSLILLQESKLVDLEEHKEK